MVPKADPGTAYGSKERILLHRSVVAKRRKKLPIGLFMLQSRGQELRQSTFADLCSGFRCVGRFRIGLQDLSKDVNKVFGGGAILFAEAL